MTRGHIMGCPFGRVWDTRGPGASFEPVSALPSVAHARGVAAIDDPRTHGPGLRIRTGLLPASVSTGARYLAPYPGRSARNIHGRSGGSARTLPGVSPFTPGACGPELNRREIG